SAAQTHVNLSRETLDVIHFAYRESTPRQIKRFINDLVGFFTLAESASDANLVPLPLTQNQPHFVKWMILHTRWPKFITLLQNDELRWHELDNELTDKNSARGINEADYPGLLKFLRCTLMVKAAPNEVLPL